MTRKAARAEAWPDEETGPRPFWRQRRWQWSAAFLALVVCTGGIAMVFGGDSDAGSAPAAGGPEIGALGPDGSRPQQCRTNDSHQEIPETAPRDVTWWELNGALTPRSATAGPLKTTGPLRWCFAHTPTGAAMAATVIPRQMSGPDWLVVTRQQLVPGFSRDYYEAMRGSVTNVEEVRTGARLAGFMVVRYSPTTATIRILVRQATATYTSADYTVDWDGVDWKLRPLSIGGLYTNAVNVFSLHGFARWKDT